MPALPPVQAKQLARVADHKTFCAKKRDADGCSLACITAPAPWSASSATFPREELWTQRVRCPRSPIPQYLVCTLAVERGGSWYTLPAVECESDKMSSIIEGIRLAPLVARPGADVLDYTIVQKERTVGHGPGGERINGTNPDDHRYIVACGVGDSGTPSCTQQILVAADDAEMTRAWSFDGTTMELAPPHAMYSDEDIAPDGGRFRVVFP